ncbi:hypothetical protein O6H91_16G057600 [Diphasiastrum complanatum]|uniref:Uncharacterized protein n=1 Tax=Diphasiastrum complanatum TaxID=34168 RepID=A0ACC2BDH3_DIPCM|nr:hypothetical protein O6H91_16G057600 [Diphasiastrum complanatum]
MLEIATACWQPIWIKPPCWCHHHHRGQKTPPPRLGFPMLKLFRFHTHRRLLRRLDSFPASQHLLRDDALHAQEHQLLSAISEKGLGGAEVASDGEAAFKFRHRRLFMRAFESYWPAATQASYTEGFPRLRGESRLLARRRPKNGNLFGRRRTLGNLPLNVFPNNWSESSASTQHYQELSYSAEQFSDEEDGFSDGQDGLHYVNLEEWRLRLTRFLRNNEQQEIISRDKKDRRHLDPLSLLASEMGLHCQMYGKVLVISKRPLPNYRPDLDDKRPQREVLLPLFTHQKVDTFLQEHIRAKKMASPAIEDFATETAALVGRVSSQRDRDTTVSLNRMNANDSEYLIQRNRRFRNKQLSWQESEEGLAMLNLRRKLPAYKEKEALLKAIANHQVLVISGETGCGKTTQLPQYVLESEIEVGRGATCNIICTQPRRISAVSVAERVAAERGEEIGDSVGYQVRLEGMRGRSTRLLFCTTGILLRRLMVDPTLKDVTHVFVDEIHERGMNEDFLLVILKELLPQRPDLRLVLMSATLNAQLFSSYFGGVPMFHIPGFTHPVKAHFLEDVLEMTGYRLTQFNQIDNYGDDKLWKMQKQLASRKRRNPLSTLAEDAMAQQDHMDYSLRTQDSLACWSPDALGFNLVEEVLTHICLDEREGAVLVFMIGWEDISALLEKLRRHPVLGNPSKVLLLGCHGSMGTAEQKLIFNHPPPGVRKIVLATNMAETSITINDVVFVVDLGKAKETSYDALNNTPCLLPSWISQASARQRRGRAGRVKPGECYHLYPKSVYDALAEYQQPELLRTPLHSLCLQIKSLQLGNIGRFLSNAMQPPEPLAVQNSVEFLKIIGALDENEDLTNLGRHLSMLPVEPKIAKMLIMGASFRCLDPILTIAAALTVRDPFLMPMEKKDLADEAKYGFSGGEFSDHIGLVHAYEGWQDAMKEQKASEYCWNNFLSMQTLLGMSSLRKQFLGLLKNAGFVNDDLEACNEYSQDGALLRGVICAGLFPGVASVVKRSRSVCFKTFEDGQVLLSSNSANARELDLAYPWLVFNEKLKTNSVMIRDSTGISDSMLLLFGGQLSSGQASGHLLMQRGFLEFFMSSEMATTVLRLRQELDSMLHKKLANPALDIYSESQYLMEAILELLHGDNCEGTFVFGKQLKIKKSAASADTSSNKDNTDLKGYLQTLLQRAGYQIPKYQTKSLKGHFVSCVEARGKRFIGEPASSKRLAEKSAAAAAVEWFLGLRDSQEPVKLKKNQGSRRIRA